MILNDNKAKWKTDKSLLETLIDSAPITDRDFDEIIDAYDTDEETAMELMISCPSGEFKRNELENLWDFESND